MADIPENDPFSVPIRNLSSAVRLLTDARAALSAPQFPPGSLLLPLAPGLLARGTLASDAPVLVPLGVGLGAPEDALFAWRVPADARALLDARSTALGALANALASARSALAVGTNTNAVLSSGAVPTRGAPRKVDTIDSGVGGAGDDGDGWAALESSLASARILETEDGGSIMMAVEDGREVAYISEFLPDEISNSNGSKGSSGAQGATSAAEGKSAPRSASSSAAPTKSAEFDALMRRLDELAKIETRGAAPSDADDSGSDASDDDGRGAVEGRVGGRRRVRFAEHDARDDDPERTGSSTAMGVSAAVQTQRSSSAARVDVLGDVVETSGVRPAPAAPVEDSPVPRVSRFLAQRRAARGADKQ